MLNFTKVKPSNTVHLEDFQKLSCLFIKEYYKNSLSDQEISKLLSFSTVPIIRDEIKDKRYNCFLVQQEKTSIGILQTNFQDNFLNISKLFLLKNKRKQKLGKEIIAFAIDFAKENNCSNIKLSIETSNKKLQMIANKLGFKFNKTIAKYLGDMIYIYENICLLEVHVKEYIDN